MAAHKMATRCHQCAKFLPKVAFNHWSKGQARWRRRGKDRMDRRWKIIKVNGRGEPERNRCEQRVRRGYTVTSSSIGSALGRHFTHSTIAMFLIIFSGSSCSLLQFICCIQRGFSPLSQHECVSHLKGAAQHHDLSDAVPILWSLKLFNKPLAVR